VNQVKQRSKMSALDWRHALTSRLPAANVWSLLSLIFMGYMTNAIYTIFSMYQVRECTSTLANNRHCLYPAFVDPLTNAYPLFQLRLYTIDKCEHSRINVRSMPTIFSAGQTLFYSRTNVKLNESFTDTIEMPLTRGARRNGTMNIVAYLVDNTLAKEDGEHKVCLLTINAIYCVQSSLKLRRECMISKHMVPERTAFNLLGGGNAHR
jgi:hypothetical protein